MPPPRFPVFSKPIVNLKGMGVGSRVLRSQAEYEQSLTPGHMWMTLLEGRHVSSDVAVVDGEPRWWRHVTGAPERGRHVRLLDRARRARSRDRGLLRRLDSPSISRGYTGILNTETIGGRMIEVHLRMSDQWPDLYGAGWVDALVRLYHERAWDFADDDRRDGYSVVLFGPHGPRYRHPPPALVDAGPASARRLQRADHVPRGHGARAPRHAAGRLSARRRECLGPAIGPSAGARKTACGTHFLAPAAA